MEKKLIEIANRICVENFMNYPDYDKDNPITTLPEALALFIWEATPHDVDIESDKIYDFLDKKLS
jgi:hypothetical protein